MAHKLRRLRGRMPPLTVCGSVHDDVSLAQRGAPHADKHAYVAGDMHRLGGAMQKVVVTAVGLFARFMSTHTTALEDSNAPGRLQDNRSVP